MTRKFQHLSEDFISKVKKIYKDHKINAEYEVDPSALVQQFEHQLSKLNQSGADQKKINKNLI